MLPKKNYKKMAKKAVSKRRAVSAPVPISVKKYVQRALDVEVQDKCDVQQILSTAGGSTSGLIRGYGIDSSLTNFGITTTSIVPSVPIGTDEDKRIGNIIRPKSLVVNYQINALPIDTGVTDVNTNEGMPFYVAVIFYTRKDNKTSSANNTLKDFGSLNVSMVNVADFLLPFNREGYNILSFQKHKMYPCQKLELVGTALLPQQLNGINGCVPAVMKTVKLPLPSKLIFDDTTAAPTNARIFCGVGVYNIDNSTPARANTIRARIDMNAVLTFQNA